MCAFIAIHNPNSPSSLLKILLKFNEYILKFSCPLIGFGTYGRMNLCKKVLEHIKAPQGLVDRLA